MLDDALSYPRRGEGVLWRHLVGGVLMLLGVFFVPIFLVYGYLVRVIAGLADGDPDPPAWDDWGALFVDGLKYVVVAFLYGIPASVLGGLIAVFATGIAVGIATDSPGLTLVFAVILGVLGLVTALVGILAGYLLPAAVVNFVIEDDLEAAFHLRTIVGNAVSWPYFAAWLKTIGVGIVLGIVGSLLLVVFLVGVLVFFYLAVVATYLLTEGYMRAAGRWETPA